MTFHELDFAGGEAHRSERAVVAPGDQIIVTVDEIPSSGYRWQVDRCPVSVSVVADATGYARDEPADKLLRIGGSRTLRLAFCVHGHHLGPLELSLRRPFDSGTPARTVAVDLVRGV